MTSTLAVRKWRSGNPERAKEINRKARITYCANHPLHDCWSAMHQRCYNPNHPQFKDYGDRGIKVCCGWHRDNPRGAINFARDMGAKPSPEHSIHRIDNNGSYRKSNCKWATSKEQHSNRRAWKKLTPQQVGYILQSSDSLRKLAAKFGVNFTAISYHRRKTQE